MKTRVSYNDPTFCAVVYTYEGIEYRFHFSGGSWFVQVYEYAPSLIKCFMRMLNSLSKKKR